jgi:hypothetical protein
MACGPRDVYNALIKAGFSTVQAIGAMANGIAESGLNAETRVIDSNGYYSDGIWQFNEQSYPNASSLVTGHCGADITAQVGFLKAHISGNALAGSTPAQVAGNFAQYFERCQQCQPGGGSYAQRVANAGVVAGWVSSGKWPASAGSGFTSSGSSSATSTTGSGSADPTCAWALGTINLHVTSVGGGCLIHKSTIRHMVGGALIVWGVGLAVPGMLVLAAFAFRASGGQAAAAASLNALGPYGRTANRVASAPTRRRQAREKAAAPARRQAATQQRQQIRQGNMQARAAAGSQAQQRRAVAGQAPRQRAIAPPAQPRAPRPVHHE